MKRSEPALSRPSRTGKKTAASRTGLLLAGALALLAGNAHAVRIDTGNPDLSVNWDNTIKYSSAFRVKSADADLLGNANMDDGNRNFNRGLISNRLDLFSELDIAYQRRMGLRISGAAWYDYVYNRSNDNPGFAGGAFPNQTSVAYDRFTHKTRRMAGRDAELLDAFVYGRFDLGGPQATVRIGQHSLLWGESLFFAANAIAGTQMPVDVAKLFSVPNTPFKEMIRPVPQISAQLQINSNLSVGAYYQTKWVASRLPAVGSYFSNNDLVIDGAENMWFAGPGMPPYLAPRGKTYWAKNSGQGGLQLKLRTDFADFGLYAIRFHNKTPQVFPTLMGIPVEPYAVPNGYNLAYHEAIKAYGASVSKTFGDINLSLEGSIRTNQDLASTGAVDASGANPFALPGDNRHNALYAIGRTAHLNLSMIGNLPRTFLWNEATIMGELAWNRVLSITKNADAADPNATRSGLALRVLVEPMYRQVFPGVDLSVPIGFSYAPKSSRPMAMHPNSWVPAGGGDISIGINGSYLDSLRFSLMYTHYYGPKATMSDLNTNAFTYKQTMKDRNFISLSARYTF